MIRVMLVDDQELIRTGFSLVLSAEADIDVVAEASTGEEALTWMREHDAAVDVVLMDVRMPGMNGIDATREIVRTWPRVRVLVLTTFDLDEYAIQAVQAGAAGFLLKDARPTELVDAITRISQGDAVLAPTMTKRLVATLLDTQHTQQAQSHSSSETPAPDAEATRLLDTLTQREREVLELITEGLNNHEISARMFLTESTVKTHVGRIFHKLHLRDRVHAVIYAKKLGL